MKMNGEFKPSCASCKGLNFRAAEALVGRADLPIALLSCTSCGAVAGAISGSQIKEDESQSNGATAKCSCCESRTFVAVLDEYSAGFKKQPALVVCSDETCQAVVGVLPFDQVWKD
ncbi:hypothetical protein D9M71_452460 [compost metagenome]